MKSIYLLGVFTLCFSFLSKSQQVALNFDGSDDYVQTTYLGAQSQDNRTIEAWIRTTANCDPNNGGKQKVIVDYGTFMNGERFTFNILWNDAIRVEIGGTGVSGKIAVNDGKWHHVAAVYNSSLSNPVRLLVDGVIDTFGAFGAKWGTTSSNNVMIGKRIDNINHFEGDIDNVKIYNIARPDSTIKKEMFDQSCTYAKGLQAYYKLSEGDAGKSNSSNKTAKDYTSGGKNGTLYNFALSGSTSNWVEGPKLIGGNTYDSLKFFDCQKVKSQTTSGFYTKSGIYTERIPNSFGCDSVITIDVTIGQTFKYVEFNACDSFITQVGQVIKKSGYYTDTLKSANSLGCDSILLMKIDIYGKQFVRDTVSSCDSSSVGSKWYFKTQIIETQGVNKNGCDSFHTTDLRIKNSSWGYLSPETCDQYQYDAKRTWQTSGRYFDTLLASNQFGCDSIVQIDLTIHQSEKIESPHSACDSFVTDAGIVHHIGGLKEERYKTSFGCDSLRVYNVTVNKSVKTYETLNACDSASVNGTWYQDDITVDLYQKTTLGCDSIISMFIDITKIDTAVLANDPMLSSQQDKAKYQWINCNTDEELPNETSQTIEANHNGRYRVAIELNDCKKESGCHSVMLASAEKFIINQSLKIYPNPNTGQFTISGLEGQSIQKVSVYNVKGQLLENVFVSGNDVQLGSERTKGMYFVKVETEKGTNYLRFEIH